MDVNTILGHVMSLFDQLGLIGFVQAALVIYLATALLKRILDR